MIFLFFGTLNEQENTKVLNISDYMSIDIFLLNNFYDNNKSTWVPSHQFRNNDRPLWLYQTSPPRLSNPTYLCNNTFIA